MANPDSTLPIDAETAAAGIRPSPALRKFARFQLLRLLGKSQRTMVWLAADSQSNQELTLVIPRAQVGNEAAAKDWLVNMERVGRLNHPCLAPVLEMGVHDRWPYVAHPRGNAVTWREQISPKGLPPEDLAHWAVQALRGLAFAHEAGVSHRDLQSQMLMIDSEGRVQLMGLEVAPAQALPTDESAGLLSDLRLVRDAAVQDVLALGLVLHQVLAGHAALDEPDTVQVMARMTPLGHEVVRLPWTVPRPIPEVLRAIVNRATDRQVRHRYRNARTFAGALEGWIKTSSESGGEPIAILVDRLRTVGFLPAAPGIAERAARLTLMEKGHTAELAAIIIDDLALTFELLRQVNGAQVRGTQIAGDGPVLMLRRAIAMLGLEAVRRTALGLRAWPGPMNEVDATELQRMIVRLKRAGRVAQRLRPAGYDPEVVFLITLLQNLGRLAVQYHFPDEADQIRRLMQPAPAAQPGGPEEPGMTAEAASFAVLGTDVESLGIAVARYWGLDDTVLQMARRLPLDALVHAPDGDNQMLRLVASCANEVVEAQAMEGRRAPLALQRVAQRYARILGFTLRDLQEALVADGPTTVRKAPSDTPLREEPPHTNKDAAGVSRAPIGRGSEARAALAMQPGARPTGTAR
jgi:non-specific serine/threonine protein kinase